MKANTITKESHYYKYIDANYNQPVVTSDGAVGMGDLACWAGSSNGSLWTWGPSGAHSCLEGSGGSLHCYANEYYAYIHLYMWLSKAVRVTGLKFYAIQDGSSGRGAPARDVTLWGSNDGVNWTQYFYDYGSSPGYPRWISYTTDSVTYYHYHRLQVANNGNSYNDLVAFSNVLLTGVYRDVIPGTPQDYDIKGDIYGCNLFKIRNKYYAIKGENDVV